MLADHTEVANELVCSEALFHPKGGTVSTTNLDYSNETNSRLENKDVLVKFSGAAKKRFKWLLKQGYEQSEARKLAQEKIQRSLSVPKKFENDSSFKERNIRLKESETDKISLVEAKKYYVKLGIVHKDFPDVLFTLDELKDVKNNIVDLILTRNFATSPKFIDLSFRRGWLFLTCEDNATADWLKLSIDDVQPGNFRILEGVDIPGQEILTAFLTDSTEYSNEKILDLMKAQNKDLSIAEWKLLSRKNGHENTTLIISMNYLCFKQLQDMNMKISYLFNKITLRRKQIGPPNETNAKESMSTLKRPVSYSSVVKHTSSDARKKSKITEVKTSANIKTRINFHMDHGYSRKKNKKLNSGKDYYLENW